MNLGLFTYITGVAALLGLIIQFTDIFPKHRESKKKCAIHNAWFVYRHINWKLTKN